MLYSVRLVDGKENHFLTLANGTWTSCHKLVNESLYDKEYVANYGFGFKQFAASIAEL